jgi:hypothetical protein
MSSFDVVREDILEYLHFHKDGSKTHKQQLENRILTWMKENNNIQGFKMPCGALRVSNKNGKECLKFIPNAREKRKLEENM